MKQQKDTEGHENRALSAWIRMLKAHNMILKEVRNRLNQSCTVAQFDVIAQLARANRGTTPAELSRRLLVTAGNVTGLIDRMEAAGLVERKSDSNDRRITRLHLTARGKSIARNSIPRHARDVQEVFSGLNDKEIEQLRHLLDKLIAGVGRHDLA